MLYPELNYRYTVTRLRDIRDSYHKAYANGIELHHRSSRLVLMYDGVIRDPMSIAEYLADFDTAVRFIGKKDIEKLGYGDFKLMKEYLNREIDENKDTR